MGLEAELLAFVQVALPTPMASGGSHGPWTWIPQGWVIMGSRVRRGPLGVPCPPSSLICFPEEGGHWRSGPRKCDGEHGGSLVPSDLAFLLYH